MKYRSTHPIRLSNGNSRRGDKTRARILDVAEQLFAKHGMDGVSMRTLVARSKVNLASVHYYFGSKKELFEEVFARRARVITDKRLKMLAECRTASDRPPLVNQILEAFLGGNPKEKQADCRRASPVTYLNKGDAPMLCFFGTKDPLVSSDQVAQIATALTSAEVPGRVELIVGAGHGWVGGEFKRTMDATMAFLDEHLKK